MSLSVLCSKNVSFLLLNTPKIQSVFSSFFFLLGIDFVTLIFSNRTPLLSQNKSPHKDTKRSAIGENGNGKISPFF